MTRLFAGRLSTLAIEPLANAVFIASLTMWIGGFAVIRLVSVLQGFPTVLWDMGWYLDVAGRGYFFNGDPMHQQNVAFLPALPLLERPLLWLHVPPFVAAELVCTAAAAVGMVLLLRALQARTSPLWGAVACALVMMSPFSLYFLNGYSEAIYLACFGACLWAMWVRKDFGLAALFVGMACAVRPYGLVLAAAWAVSLFVDARRDDKSAGTRIREFVLFAPLCMSGYVLTSLFFYREFDDLFLYRNIMMAWGFDALSSGPADFLEQFAAMWRVLTDFDTHFPATQIARVMFWTGLAITPLAARRIPKMLSLYGVLLLAFVFFTGESGANVGRHLATNVSLPLGILALIWHPPSSRSNDAPSRRKMMLILVAWIIMAAIEIDLILRFSQGQWIS